MRPDTKLATHVVPAVNCEARRGAAHPDILLVHYTGMASCARAIDWLCRAESRVSCHYAIDLDGEITQMVPEALRAWHAGAGVWAGDRDINSRSIGIEIHNPGHDLGYPDFSERQMQAMEALGRDIVARWGIRPERVIGHSDIAPLRKSDPGERFDWRRLAAAGVGLSVDGPPADADDPGIGPGGQGSDVAEMQAALERYGYGVPRTGVLDGETLAVVAAFQRHFRQGRVDGRIDASTRETIARLNAAIGRR